MTDQTPISTPDMWPDALAHLRARHAGGGRVNYVGGPADSITEGVGASDRRHGWWSRFAAEMASSLGRTPRSIGSAEIAPDTMWPVWSVEGHATATGRGLGRYGTALLPGAVARTEQVCDRIELLVDETTQAFDLPGGVLEIRIDDRVADELDCSRADVVSRRWDSGPLGPLRRRSVELRCIRGGFVSVAHSYFHDGLDDTSVLFWRNAHARFHAGTDDFGFANPHSSWFAPFTTGVIGRNPANGRDVRGGGSIEPDCFLCCTGTNDVRVEADDRAAIRQTTARLVDFIRDRCDTEASIGFIVPSASRSGDDRAFENLLLGVRDACIDRGAFLIDLLHGVGTHADDSLGFYADGYHPNDRGHAAWAAEVHRWMLDAVRPDDVGVTDTRSRTAPDG